MVVCVGEQSESNALEAKTRLIISRQILQNLQARGIGWYIEFFGFYQNI